MSGAEPLRVLALDDDPGILDLLSARLRDEPIHLVTCSELEAAETLLDHMRFAVVIVDLEVSELGGLEGMRVIRHAVANFPDTAVLIFSGNVTPRAHRLAAALGVTEVFEKPVDLGRLLDFVHRTTIDPFFEGRSADRHQLTVVEPLEQILAEKSISSVFQPVFQLAGNGSATSFFGVEALARGPAGSLLSNPAILFDYAVRKELVFETDMLCVRTALLASKGLRRDARLFLNTHPRALSHPDSVATLNEMLAERGISHDQVVLELTEQSAIVDTAELAEILDRVRKKGIQVALDDFGEGSSNLHLVHDLRPELIKITGLFAQQIQSSARRQALVKAAVDLCRHLDMRSVVERVESDEELEMLRSLGIDYGQGFHLGRPEPPGSLAEAWPQEGAEIERDG